MTQFTEQTGPSISEDQAAYARILAGGVLIALALLAVTFVVYFFELREAHVPPGEVSRRWAMSSKEYLRESRLEPGWGWTRKIGKADLMVNVGICVLISVSGVAYIRVLPIFVRKKRWPLVCVAVAELLTILLAASGLIVAGH